MSKQSNSKKGNNLFHKVTYTGAVLILLACILLLVFNNQRRKMLFERQVEIAASNEMVESLFTEQEMDTTPTPGMDAPVQQADANVPDMQASPAANVGEVSVTPDPYAAQSTTTDDLLQNIVVLNGLGEEGLTRYWAGQLEQAGFMNVASAGLNTMGSPDNTVIYVQNGANGEALRSVFPNAQFTMGVPNGTIEALEGESLPEQVDIYVLIGRNDGLTG